MIAYLRGIPISFWGDDILFLAGEVGYSVIMNKRDAGFLREGHSSPQAAPVPTNVWVETLFRENMYQCFGFLQRQDQEWFRWLLLVPGVGGRMALSVLSVFPAEELQQVIVHENASELCRAEGVGPKLAQRVIHELQKRAREWINPFAARHTSVATEKTVAVMSAWQEALRGLSALGYKTQEGEKALESVLHQQDKAAGHLTSIELIRLALAHLTKGVM